MSIGDRRYRTQVPEEAQRFAIEAGLGEPEWFVPALEVASQYPDSVRRFLAEAARRIGAEDPSLVDPVDAAILREIEAMDSPSNGHDHGRGDATGRRTAR